MPVENGWAICSGDGLYVGWQMSRAEAIAEHVSALYGTAGRGLSGLCHEQVVAWKKCKKRGDRAVKIKIIYSR